MSQVARKGKPKKKENFLRKAKRHGRKGNYGKGRSLSEEEYSYYMRVFEQLSHLEGEEKGQSGSSGLIHTAIAFLLKKFMLD